MKKRSVLAGALTGLVLIVPSLARAQQAPVEGWAFSLTPYLWLPAVKGTLNYGVPPGAAGRPSVGVDADDYLSNLDFALMLAGEARKDRWTIFTDVVALDFSGEDSSVKSVNFGGSVVGTTLNSGSSTSIKGLLWTLAGGYAAVQSPEGNLDVFGGFRYFGLKASTDWQLSATVAGPQGGAQTFPRTGSISQKEDLLDAIVGVRGRVRLGTTPWSLPYYLDVGTGSSNLTWQGLLGVAYTFKWGDAVLAYRYLSVDQGSGKLVQDLSFGGLALGATFRF
ncbi:hypothetical protein ACIPRI_19925 [Variovorax sp. LARHSF232]